MDEDELKAELDELEQEQLEGELAGAHAVPVHSPSKVDDRRECFATGRMLRLNRSGSFAERAPPTRSQEEEDEEEELRQLQATLAM